jgi:hypothetical protein
MAAFSNKKFKEAKERGWCIVAASSFPELSITLYSSATQSSPAYLVCTQKTLHDHPPAGLVSRVRVVISESGEYELQILFRSVEKGVVDLKLSYCKYWAI